MRQIIATILLFAALTTSAQQSTISYKDIVKTNPDFAVTLLYADGVQARLMGEIEKAKQLFTQLLVLNDRHAATHYQLALISEEQDNAKMMEHATKAYEIEPENEDYARLYVKSLYTNGEMGRALEMLAQARAHGKGNRQNYFVSIVLAAQMGDAATVDELSRFYLDKYGFAAPVVDILSETMVSKRQFAAAEQMLESYVETNPMEPSIKISLAKVKAVLFKDAQAVELFRAAIALDSTDYQSHLALADYYRINKDTPNYLAALRPVFESNSLEPKIKAEYFERTFFDPVMLKEYYISIQQIALTMYASDPYNHDIEDIYTRFMMYTGDVKSARQLLSIKIDEKRADEKTFTYLIEIENYLKEPDSALRYAQMGSEQFQSNTLFPMMIASIESERGNNKVALRELAVVFKRATTDSLRCTIKSFEGDIYFKMGNSRKAFAAYDMALKYDKDNAMLLNNYAYYLSLEKKSLDKALSMSERSNHIEQGNATYLDTQAWILYELGRYEEARTIQRRAIALSSDKSSDLLLHYGDILYKLGERFLAETYWKQAAEAGADSEQITQRLNQK